MVQWIGKRDAGDAGRSWRRQANKKRTHVVVWFRPNDPVLFLFAFMLSDYSHEDCRLIPEFTCQRDFLQIMKCVEINQSFFWFEQKTDTANIYQRLVLDVNTGGYILAWRLHSWVHSQLNASLAKSVHTAQEALWQTTLNQVRFFTCILLPCHVRQANNFIGQ